MLCCTGWYLIQQPLRCINSAGRSSTTEPRQPDDNGVGAGTETIDCESRQKRRYECSIADETGLVWDESERHGREMSEAAVGTNQSWG